MSQNQHPTRIFQIGDVRITEDESMRDKSPEEVRAILKHLYPQVEHAAIREHTADGVTTLAFIPQAGRKG